MTDLAEPALVALEVLGVDTDALGKVPQLAAVALDHRVGAVPRLLARAIQRRSLLRLLPILLPGGMPLA